MQDARVKLQEQDSKIVELTEIIRKKDEEVTSANNANILLGRTTQEQDSKIVELTEIIRKKDAEVTSANNAITILDRKNY